MTGFPRVLRGAFVEYGPSLSPVIVPFQFNPVQLQRSRSLSFRAPNDVTVRAAPEDDEDGERRIEREADLHEWHRGFDDLTRLRDNQVVTIGEETVSFELLIDATDDLDDGNIIAGTYGIAPRLAVLEQMTQPDSEGLRPQAPGNLLGSSTGHVFTGTPKPPLVLFVWGVQRVVPVNVTSLGITETEFDAMLNPVRANVTVELTVIGAADGFSLYTQAMRQTMASLHSDNLVTYIEVPG